VEKWVVVSFEHVRSSRTVQP